MVTNGILKLKAQDHEDIQVVSAVLQDAIVPLCDMAYQPEQNTFVLVAQRLRREAEGGEGERICSALTIKGVTAAQVLGIDQADHKMMLDLLAIMLEPSRTTLHLIFAGNGRVKLQVADWVAALEDFGEPWPAQCNPCHDEKTTKKA
jgi:hypothetical protein